jgi:hypothetical protein
MDFFKKIALCGKNIFTMIFYRKPTSPTKRFPPKPKPPIDKKKGVMKYYLNDPAYPNLIGEVTDPKPMGLSINVPNLQPGNFDFNSPQGIANNTMALLCHGINMFNQKFNLNKWAVVSTLQVNTMAGFDANAYYDRSSLKFFYFNGKNNTQVYTALSSDIVSHELGHALLDALRPDFFSAAAMEVWAFHESFGDVNSILCALYHDELVNYVLNETNFDLRKSNLVSKVAEQFGVNLGKSSSLREAANNYKYVNPASLPTKSNDPNAIVREPHSFSKIMTGTVYEVLCRVYEKYGKNKDALLKARDYVRDTFYKACTMAPSTTNFYEAFGQAWMKQDESMGGQNKDIINSVFSDRGIFKIRMMAVQDSQASEKEKIESVKTPNMHLQKCRLDCCVSDLFKDEIGGLSTNEYISDMKVQLAVDNLYLKDMDDDDIGWQNVSDTVEQAKVAAKNLVEYILENKLIGQDDSDVWFKDNDGYLKRRLFQCDCYRPNYLFPGNPEYNKPYKPKNNSGCCTYGSCANLTPNPAPSIQQSCNIRYGSSCKSVSFNGKSC